MSCEIEVDALKIQIFQQNLRFFETEDNQIQNRSIYDCIKKISPLSHGNDVTLK